MDPDTGACETIIVNECIADVDGPAISDKFIVERLLADDGDTVAVSDGDECEEES